MLSQKKSLKLSDKEKQKLEQRAEKLEGKLEESMRKVRNAEKESEDAFEELERETAKRAIAGLFDIFRQSWKGQKRIISHLGAIEEDILAKIRRFIHDDRPTSNEPNEQQAPTGNVKRRAFEEEEEGEFDEPLFTRYRVNVLVTHPKDAGAPVVFETHPTSSRSYRSHRATHARW